MALHFHFSLAPTYHIAHPATYLPFLSSNHKFHSILSLNMHYRFPVSPDVYILESIKQKEYVDFLYL